MYLDCEIAFKIDHSMLEQIWWNFDKNFSGDVWYQASCDACYQASCDAQSTKKKIDVFYRSAPALITEKKIDVYYRSAPALITEKKTNFFNLEFNERTECTKKSDPSIFFVQI